MELAAQSLTVRTAKGGEVTGDFVGPLYKRGVAVERHGLHVQGHFPSPSVQNSTSVGAEISPATVLFLRFERKGGVLQPLHLHQSASQQ